MTNDTQDFAALKKRFDSLVQIVRSLDEHIRLSDKINADAQATMRAELDLIHRNQRFLFEKLLPVFQKTFPDDWKYQAEFDRLLGTGPKPDGSEKDS